MDTDVFSQGSANANVFTHAVGEYGLCSQRQFWAQAGICKKYALTLTDLGRWKNLHYSNLCGYVDVDSLIYSQLQQVWPQQVHGKSVSRVTWPIYMDQLQANSVLGDGEQAAQNVWLARPLKCRSPSLSFFFCHKTIILLVTTHQLWLLLRKVTLLPLKFVFLMFKALTWQQWHAGAWAHPPGRKQLYCMCVLGESHCSFLRL